MAKSKHAKHFRVARKGQYFRLTHIPSGDYVQRHLSDFLTHKDAIACRNRMLAAAPEWDWSDPNFLQNTSHDEFHRIWRAIYD